MSVGQLSDPQLKWAKRTAGDQTNGKRGHDLTAGFGERAAWSLAIILTLLQLISPTGLSQEQDKGPPVIIHMTDEMKFVPDRLTVRVGQAVEWVNDADDGGVSHVVATDPEKAMDPNHVSSPAGAKVFDSGSILPGKSFTYIFKVPGLYKYVCPPHEGTMRGQVTVEP